MGLGIGIDLGTSYTSVGVFRNDRFEAIPNEEGDLTMPCFVAFTDKVRLIGVAAKNQLLLNPRNTVFNVHRLVGRRFADANVQADIKHLPFRVIDRLGKPAIQVEYRGELKVLIPEEIIAMILTRMKETAERYLGETVENAVITAPMCWNASQRQSIRDAGLIARLNVLNVLAAPTCAALTYVIDKKSDIGNRNILVFDLGGGTFGAVLATIEDEIIEVRSVAGDTHLGGEDFDNRLVNHFANEFKSRYSKDLTWNSRALCRLRIACEHVKRTLSSATRATIDIEHLYEGIDFKAFITRDRFEELCQDLVHSTTTPVDRLFSDAKIDKTEIHEILLIGGSTRMPGIQKRVIDYFDGKEPSKSLNPDQAACYGAAVYGAIYSGDTSSPSLNRVLLLDVVPLSLGIETGGGVVTSLVRRNTSFPTKKSNVFGLGDFGPLKNNNELTINVYEGERVHVKDNNHLGTFALMNVHPESQIRITFDLDNQLTVHVHALDQRTGQSNSSYITCKNTDQLSKEDLVTIMEAARKYKRDAEAEAIRISAKNALESQIYSFKATITDLTIAGSLNASEKEVFQAKVDRSLTWFEDNQSDTAEEFIFRRKELEVISSLLKLKLNSTGEA